MLEDHGHPIDAEKFGFSTSLTTKAKFPKMWSSEPRKPCQYTPSGGDTGELWIYIPLQNDDTFEMPSGNSTETPSDLSDLLLQDVEIGITETSNRIEDAIRSVQKLVQQGWIGLGSRLDVTEMFFQFWGCNFANFKIWVAWTPLPLRGEFDSLGRTPPLGEH